MATKTQFTCDICGKVKGETNHWFLGRLTGSFVVRLEVWDWELSNLGEVSHLCGEQCAIKFLSNWMAEQQKASKA